MQWFLHLKRKSRCLFPLFSARPETRLRSAAGYLFSLGILVLTTIISLAAQPFLNHADIAWVYLTPVVVSATSWGLGPSVFTSILAVLAVDALFDPPYGLLSPSDARDVLTLSVFLLIAVVISRLGSRVRTQREDARRRERQTGALYRLSRDMAFATNRTEILDAAVKQISAIFDAESTLFVPNAGRSLQPLGATMPNEAELGAAEWTFEHGQAAGDGTAVLGQSRMFYLPLRTAQGTFGVLGLRSHSSRVFETSEQHRLLETFAGQIAVALEHSKLNEQAEQARILEASDRFRNALLASLSHDLLTPITSIMGSVTTLMDRQIELEPQTRYELLEDVKADAAQLKRHVANLLDMTRLEGGGLYPQRDWNSIEEVIGVAVARNDGDGHAVQVTVQPNLPLVQFDFPLIEQVLMNLLDNAFKFSPPRSCVEVCAARKQEWIEVSIADRGSGVPLAELQNIFGKFYRLQRNGSPGGTGLGLSICKGIVEAHAGKIWAARREGGGLRITFTLPAHEYEGTP